MVGGRRHDWSTVTRCTHDWWHDEPSWEAPLALDHPRALAAYERGVAAGRAELAALRGDQPAPEVTELSL